MHFLLISLFAFFPKFCFNMDEIIEVLPESPPPPPPEQNENSILEILTEMPPESPKPQNSESTLLGGNNFEKLAKTILNVKKFRKNLEAIKIQKNNQKRKNQERLRDLLKKAKMENEITKHWKSTASQTQSLRAEYLSKIVKPDKYYWPQEFGGVVDQVSDKEGWLTSEDPMVSALLEFSIKIFAIEFPEEDLKKLKGNLAHFPKGGCRLIFGPEKRENELFHNVFLFEQGCMHNREKMGGGQRKKKNSNESGAKEDKKEKGMEGMGSSGEMAQNVGESGANKTGAEAGTKEKEKEEEKKDEELEKFEEDFYNEEYKVKLSTLALLGAVKNGPEAFGKKAELDWRKLPKFVPSTGENQREKNWGMIFMLKRAVNFVSQKVVYKEVELEKELGEKEAEMGEKGGTGGGGKGGGKSTEGAAKKGNEEFKIDITPEIKEGEREKLKGELEKTIENLEKALKIEEEKEREKAAKNERKSGGGQRKFAEQKIHPWKFLQRVRFSIRAIPAKEELKNDPEANIGCGFLKSGLIERALYGNEHQVTQDLRGRLGAQILFSVINIKKFTRDLGLAMLASILFSGAVGSILNILAWNSVVAHVAKWEARIRLGSKHLFSQILGIILYCVTTFLTQFGDSFGVARVLVKMRGGKMFTNRWQVWEDFKDAFKSALVAMFGSGPNNANVHLNPFEKPFWMLATDLLAAATSAAMIPIQYEKMEQNLAHAVLIMIDKGFFAGLNSKEIYEKASAPRDFFGKAKGQFLSMILPRKSEENVEKELAEKVAKIDEKMRRKAMEELVKERIKLSMELEKTTGMMINSMGIGAIMALLGGFLPSYVGAKLGFITQKVQTIINNFVFQTNESYSLGIGYLTANRLGGEKIQRFFGTDLSKNKQMVEIILRKGIVQLERGDEKMEPIEDGQIRRIYHPLGQLSFPIGKMIVWVINWIVNSTTTGWRVLRGKKGPEKLIDKMEMKKLEEGHQMVKMDKRGAREMMREIEGIFGEYFGQNKNEENEETRKKEKVEIEGEKEKRKVVDEDICPRGNEAKVQITVKIQESGINDLKEFAREIKKEIEKIFENVLYEKNESAKMICPQNLIFLRSILALNENLREELEMAGEIKIIETKNSESKLALERISKWFERKNDGKLWKIYKEFEAFNLDGKIHVELEDATLAFERGKQLEENELKPIFEVGESSKAKKIENAEKMKSEGENTLVEKNGGGGPPSQL